MLTLTVNESAFTTLSAFENVPNDFEDLKRELAAAQIQALEYDVAIGQINTRRAGTVMRIEVLEKELRRHLLHNVSSCRASGLSGLLTGARQSD